MIAVGSLSSLELTITLEKERFLSALSSFGYLLSAASYIRQTEL